MNAEQAREGPKNKAEFRRRYEAGEFGNRLRQWDNLQELRVSGYRGLVSARHRTRSAGPDKFLHAKPAQELLEAWPSKHPAEEFYFNESPPDDLLLMQGEVSLGEKGLQLTYSTTPGISLREAINARRAEHAFGELAAAVLRHFLWASDRDDLYGLLADYPHAVVEFSAFDLAVGCYPVRNTVIWELREY